MRRCKCGIVSCSTRYGGTPLKAEGQKKEAGKGEQTLQQGRLLTTAQLESKSKSAGSDYVEVLKKREKRERQTERERERERERKRRERVCVCECVVRESSMSE